MVSNPNFYGQSTHGTPNQIEDGVDFPHTGIVKALSDGLGQNYAISGFDITIDSATQIDVGAGVIFRDGKKVAVSAVANLTLSSTYTNGYHLLIASSASSPVLTIRNPTAADKVAQYTAGDTIIAVITHNGTANVGIQYLTVDKTENSLSVGYNNSGYTETGTLTADANGITMTGLYKLDTLPTATVATDDKIILQDTNDSDIIKTATAQQIADLSAYNSFNTDFAAKDTDDLSEGSTNLYHTNARAISAAEGEATLDLTGTLTVANGVVFNEAGASVDFRVESNNNVNMLVVDGSQDGVGINVASPDAELHVNGVSKTKGLVVNLTEQTAAPAPFNTYDITDENYIILASLDPIGNNLTLNLPSASSTRQGQIYRLILPVTGTGSLKIDVQSGDSLNDKTRSPLTTPYEILSQTTPTGAAGDIWEVICLSGTEWIAYKL